MSGGAGRRRVEIFCDKKKKKQFLIQKERHFCADWGTEGKKGKDPELGSNTATPTNYFHGGTIARTD